MKAHIVKRQGSKGPHYAVVVELGRDAEGKRGQKWHQAGTTKKQADAKLDSLLRQLGDHTYTPPSDLTLSEYLDDYLAGLKSRFGQQGKKGLARGTWEGYRRIVEHHLKPELGSLKLTDLRSHHVEKYESRMLEDGWAHWGSKGKGERKRGLSPTTVLQHHRVLRKALSDAVRKGIIAANPCDAVQAPGAATTHLRTLDATEAGSLLAMASGTPMHMPVLIALTTGMRCGEVCALRWRDVDLDAAVVRVQRAAVEEDGKRVEAAPKSGEARSITIDAATVAALKAQKDANTVRSLQRDDYACTVDGRAPWSSNGLSIAFRAFAKRNAVKDFRFHDMRHTHATLLAAAGEHPRVVQERLGHADVAFTLRRYTGFWTNMQAGAAEKIEGLLGEAITAAVATN